MSIIYSYPEQGALNANDMLIGTSAEKVGGKQKNITRNFSIQQIADFINRGAGFVDPIASDFQIPVFNQEGKKITGSIMSQNIYPNGSAITIAGSLTATGAISTVNNLTASGIVSLGSQNNLISLNSITKLGGPIKDAAGTIGNVNQILLSNGSGNVTWTNYEAGLTYEGTWDANANTTNGLSNSPALLQGVGVSGHFYIVNVEGTTSLGPGLNDWHVGDWAVFLDEGGQPASWQKIDNTSTLVGSGTAGTFAKWTNATTLNDSIMSESGTVVSVDGDLKVKDTVEATTTNSNLKLKGNGTGGVEIMSADGTTDGKITLNCSQNSHGVTLQSPPHAAAQSWTWILPQTTGGANDVLTTDGNTPSQLSWTTPTTGTVTGTGAATQVTFWDGTSNINGDTAFNWDNTNKRLGVGTAAPSAQLEISKDSDDGTNAPIFSITNASTTLNDGADIGTIQFKNSDLSSGGPHVATIKGIANSSDERTAELAFSTGSIATTSEAMRIDSSGNVGIGTDSPSSYYTGANNLVINNDSGSGLTIASNDTSDGSIYFADGTSGASAYAGYMEYNHNSDFFRIGVDALEAMRIDSSGNVGIGTTSPSKKLEVVGDVKFGDVGAFESSTNLLKSSITGFNGFLIRSAVSSDSNPSYSSVDDTNTGMFLPGSDVVAFTTAGSEKMRINSTGNVGIGTTSPSTKLHVDGKITADTHFTSSDLNATLSSSGTGGNIYLRPNGNSNSTGQVVVKGSGSVGIGTDSPAVSLDISATDAVQMPVGVTNDRPTTGVASNGMLRYNSTNNGFEGYINGNWGDIGGGSSGGLIFRGTFDASTGAIASGGSLYTCPAGGSGGTVDTAIGDLYIVTTAGSFFCSGTSLNVGDEVICTTAATATNDNVNNWNAVASGAGGAVTGSGTTNYVPKFTGATVVGNSSIFDNGSVGIGTNNPSRKLHVSTNQQVTSLFESSNQLSSQIQIKNGLSNNGGFIKTTGDNIILTANSTGIDHLVVASGGDVGIGTTSPDTKLTIENASAGPASSTYATTASNANLHLSAVGVPFYNHLFMGIGSATYAWIQAQHGNDTAQDLALNPIGGNVGIGTDSPDTFTKLSVSTPQSGGASGTGITLSGWNGTSQSKVQLMSYGIDDGTFAIRSGSSNTERMRINSAGNVGIGTDNPSAKLDINGSKNSTNLIVQSPLDTVGGGSLADYSELLFDNNQLPGNSGQAYIRHFANSHNDSESAIAFGTTSASGITTEALRIIGNGNVGIGTDQPEVSLDLGSKNDAVSLPAGDNTARGNIANPEVGMIRYNTTDYQFEGYSGVGAAATWGALGGGGTPTISKQLFQVTTATPTFVLNSPQVNPQDANYVNIFIDGVYQNSGTYTVATATGVTTVTLNTDAPVGTSVEIISTT
jgi:hypothetical protein